MRDYIINQMNLISEQTKLQFNSNLHQVYRYWKNELEKLDKGTN